MGGLIHGAAFDPDILIEALYQAGVCPGSSLNPNLIPLNDSKAQATVIAHTGEQWHVIPPQIDNIMGESDYNDLKLKTLSNGGVFSNSNRNHSTCVVVGEKDDIGPRGRSVSEIGYV